MARKRKKSKRNKKPVAGASATTEAAAEATEPPSEAATTEGKATKGAKKKGAAKKGGAKKGTAKKKAPKKKAPAKAAPAEDEPETIDLDADLDEHGDEVADLVAQALALDHDRNDAPSEARPTPAENPAAEVIVEDLDAVLDQEDDLEEARNRLIAEALAFVEEEEAGESSGSPADVAEHPLEASADASAAPRDSDAGTEAEIAVDEASDPETASVAMSPEAAAVLEAIKRGSRGGDFDADVIDLGGVSDPGERDRLLASALAHSEMQEARYRVTSDRGAAGRGKGTIASVLFVIAIIAFARPPAFLVPPPSASLTDADELYGVRVTLLMQAQQIEAFRVRQESLPRSLAEVDASLPGIRFVRTSNRLYQLIAYTAGGDAVVYDSAAPDPAFGEIERLWVTTRGRT